ncbi:hypothetical protein ACF0H5_005003 [Mactra antiquata]
MYLKPSDIYYSQDSVCAYFDKRSLYRHRRIGETLDDICEGRCSITDIPTIAVIRENGRWITADNRRLWVFRHLERLGKCYEIPVRQTHFIPDDKKTAPGGGTSVRVRGQAGGYWQNQSNNRVSSYQQPVSSSYSYNSSSRASSREFFDNDFSSGRNYSTGRSSSYVVQPERTTSYNYSSRPQPQEKKQSDSWCTIL